MLRLDVANLHKCGALESGRAGQITWNRGGGETATVSFQGLGYAVKLMFRVRVNGGEWEEVSQTIHLERTPCRYGGNRPWFTCPGCWGRVGVLYGLRAFLCRFCHKLTYASQSEDRPDRLLRRANKIRARLGGKAGVSSFIVKPKGMRWATFERMEQEIRQFENTGLLLAMNKFRMVL
ncbi:MAG: hypothetical protein ACOZEN_07435 [Thermodesulfobacteriota bacterium]